MDSQREDDNQTSPEELLLEAKRLVELIEANLPKRNDPASISLKAKIPFKAVDCREALLWRSAELSRSALLHFERGELASAFVLTRALLECTAATWYLAKKIRAAIDAKSVGSLDEVFMRMLVGSKNQGTDLEAINVLTFVRHVEKDLEGFEEEYNTLSEVAHPNWLGTLGLFARHDEEKIWTDFGKNIRGLEGIKETGLINLNVGLSLLEMSYNQMTDLMPAFVSLCESELE